MYQTLPEIPADAQPLDDGMKVRVRHAPESPSRQIRIDYGALGHEYVTIEDAHSINVRSTLRERCWEAVSRHASWAQLREAYGHLSAILLALDKPTGTIPCLSEEDFDLFPEKPAQVVTGAKVSDSDDPEPEGWAMSIDMRAVTDDPVHAPSHYTDGGIETIDYMEAKLSPAEFIGFCRGNALKYLSRAGKKGDAAEDFAKAAWYCARAEKASR
jgi:hypothetical protein